MAKKERKLEKTIKGNIITFKEIITGQELVVDITEYPTEIQEKLAPFGASHKIGDSAAGVQGQDAYDAMVKTHEAMMAGQWKIAGQRGESVSVNSINSGIDKLPEAEQVAARQLMLKLKILKPQTQEDVDYLKSIGIEASLSVNDGAMLAEGAEV